MNANGLSLVKWPVGTGPYMMTEYVQDRRHVMKRNPNFRGDPYPCEGEPGDKDAPACSTTAARRCPSPTPFVSTIVKEKVPRKEMFKQGYLDVPEIERPEWGVEFRVDMDDSDHVTSALYEGARLRLSRRHDRHQQLVPRLQLARPGRRQGRHARAAGQEPQAAPGAVDRDRLGGGLRQGLPHQGRGGRARARAGRASSARATARPKASTR